MITLTDLSPEAISELNTAELAEIHGSQATAPSMPSIPSIPSIPGLNFSLSFTSIKVKTEQNNQVASPVGPGASVFQNSGTIYY
jgi:hypothetical protein